MTKQLRDALARVGDVATPNMALHRQVGGQAAAYLQKSRAPATLRAYAADWLVFEEWAKTSGRDPLPASSATVADYAAFLAGRDRKVNTIVRAVSAIRFVHLRAGHDSPCGTAVSETMAGIRRDYALRRIRVRKKSAAATVHLRAANVTLGTRLIDHRNRAILLFGFAGAFRRSELVGLCTEDLLETENGYIVTLTRSKTDQTGEGQYKGIPYGEHPETCPVRALQRWLRESGVQSGPVFRPVSRYGKVSPHALEGRVVGRIVKQAMQSVGLDPRNFAGHSLRSGLVTEALKAGHSLAAIMAQTGHKSVQTVMGYVRATDLFKTNASKGVGL